jgi:nickel superoxide dismutase
VDRGSVKPCMLDAAASGDADFQVPALIIKEEGSDLVKHHLWVLWTDHLKPPLF